MKIKRLVIENFKSIERIELLEPNPFTVFVGPNGSGKSNIFEALEFENFKKKFLSNEGASDLLVSLFGGATSFLRRQSIDNWFNFEIETEYISIMSRSAYSREYQSGPIKFVSINQHKEEPTAHPDYEQFYRNFTRLFIRNEKLRKLPLNDDKRLALDASNLEKVLKRILTDDILKNEIFEWLDLFVPGFKTVEIDDRDELHWFEKSSSDYFTKDLISDGTYNILSLLTAVYQSNEPQFLCIEEPENGLHPQVLETLVDFFRQQCKDKGHFIWLNTHSEAIVRHLTTDEIILVNKHNGATQTRQIKGRSIYDLPTDQAWLTGALGGGLPW